MATWLKEAITKEERDEVQKQIRDTVEKLLEDIDKRGDEAVRELSERFDNWAPDEFQLSEKEVRSCIDRLDKQTIDLNELFPDADTDLNHLFPDDEVKHLLKNIIKNKKDMGLIKERLATENKTPEESKEEENTEDSSESDKTD